MQITGIGAAGPPPAVVATNRSAPASPQSPKPAAPAPDHKQLEQAVQAANRTIESAANNSIEFSINQDNGEAIVRVVDTETGQLIRQIPSQEIIEISRALERLQGLLLRQKA